MLFTLHTVEKQIEGNIGNSTCDIFNASMDLVLMMLITTALFPLLLFRSSRSSSQNTLRHLICFWFYYLHLVLFDWNLHHPLKHKFMCLRNRNGVMRILVIIRHFAANILAGCNGYYGFNQMGLPQVQQYMLYLYQ